MIKCKFCDKEFQTNRQLYGHMKVHTDDYEGYKKRISDTYKDKYEKTVLCKAKKYNENPKYCPVCNKIIPFNISSRETCSKSCAASLGNKRRAPMSKETKERISNTLKSKPKKGKSTYSIVCKICGKQFTSYKKNTMLCSKECSNENMSQKRINYLIKNGTTNSATRLTFNYNGIEYQCDSKMEAAAIIYLFIAVGVDKVERFKSILNFVDENGQNRKFNPDFYVTKNDKIIIVEVKQVWDNSIAVNNYNKYFKEKENAIIDFCEKRNYEYMWLDFNYDKKFKTIYRKFLANPDFYK